jgi:3-mercaptopyruvate sulfurtransferase SseA
MFVWKGRMSNLKRLLLAGAAVVAVIAALWFTNRAVTPKEATWPQVRAEAAAGGYRLITTDELSRLYRKNQDMLLVDTRQDWEYRTGHIRGAVNFPMEPTWWSRWSKKEALAKFLGPDKDKLLVFY